MGTVTEIFPLFVHARPCFALRLVPLAIYSLLGHVPQFLAWQMGEDRIWLVFWAHTADIPQEVDIHLGIFW